MLTQKDADLRESIKTVTQMQKDHNDALQHERQRANGFEDEARELRTRANEAEAAKVRGRPTEPCRPVQPCQPSAHPSSLFMWTDGDGWRAAAEQGGARVHS